MYRTMYSTTHNIGIDRHEFESPRKMFCATGSSCCVRYFGDHCIKCAKILHGGGYYVFECGFHALCTMCVFNALPEIESGCNMCVSEHHPGEIPHTEYDQRNSLPPIPMSQTSALRVGPSSLKYDYKTESNMITVSSVITENTLLETPNPISDMGLSDAEDGEAIIACGMDTPTLSVITPNGIRAIHTLNKGDMISSICMIKRNRFLVCIGYNNGVDVYGKKLNSYQLHYINLDVQIPNPSIITPFALPMTTECGTDEPIHLAKVDSQRIGLLGRRRYRTIYTDKGYEFVNTVQMYPLDSLLTANEIGVDKIQSQALWGRRVIVLNGSNGDWENSMSVTSRGHLCLSVWVYGNIRIYSPTGVYLITVGIQRGLRDPLKPGALFHPTTLLCLLNGDMMVVGERGDIHVLTSDSCTYNHHAHCDDRSLSLVRPLLRRPIDDVRPVQWKILKTFNKDATYSYWSVLSNSRIWTRQGFNKIGMLSFL